MGLNGIYTDLDKTGFTSRCHYNSHKNCTGKVKRTGKPCTCPCHFTAPKEPLEGSEYFDTTTGKYMVLHNRVWILHPLRNS